MEIVKTQKNILETTLEQATAAGDGRTIRRSATIIVEDGVFKCCRFKLSSDNSYTLEDWMFLLEVAKWIQGKTEDEK